jgi:hypothetical protein
MISFPEIEKSLEKDLGELEPELRQLALIITDVRKHLRVKFFCYKT